MRDAALACVLPPTYTRPCSAHGVNGSTAHAGSLVATEVPYSVLFITFYHLKAPKSLYSEKSSAAFPPVQKGCKRGEVHAAFLQSNLNLCFLLSRLKLVAAIPRQKFSG